MPIIEVQNWMSEMRARSWHAVKESQFQDVLHGAMCRDAKWTRAIAVALRDAAVSADVPGLDTADLVTVSFDHGRVLEDDHMVVIWVKGLFVRPDRSAEVRDRLAKQLYETAELHLLPGEQVEVFIEPFSIDEVSERCSNAFFGSANVSVARPLKEPNNA
jgi:hypothetical protein